MQSRHCARLELSECGNRLGLGGCRVRGDRSNWSSATLGVVEARVQGEEGVLRLGEWCLDPR